MVRLPRVEMTVDSMEFRKTLGRFPTGVTVMTTLHDGVDYGLTANAFSSVSLDPPLVLVCIDRKAETWDILKKSRIFAINLLGDDQKEISVNFSRPELKSKRFVGLGVRREVTGAAILEESIGFIDCRVVSIHEAGDHDIFVGQVERLGHKDGYDPLLFYAGKYRKIGQQID